MMKQTQYFMGIDNGGSNVKCAIFDMQGHELAAASIMPSASQPYPGFVERDSEEIWRCNCTVIAQALHASGLRADQISAISLCGYGGGICLLDAQGRCIYPLVVSTDIRASLQAARLNASPEGEHFFSITHQRPWPSQLTNLLRWFQEKRPQILEKAQYALSIKDYIRSRLTQEYALELTDASNNGLIDPSAGTLSDTLLRLSGLEEYRRLFSAPVLAPLDIGGYVTRRAAEETGLAPGTPVAAGSYDVSACTIGCGALVPSCLAVTNGTWTIASYLDTAFAHADPSTLVTAAPLSGHFLLEQGSATGTVNLNWYLDRFLSKIYPDHSKQQLYELCAQAVSSSRPQEDLVFVPYLYANTGGSEAKGAFFGLDSRHNELDLLYAVMEGVLWSTLRHIQLLCWGRAPFEEIRLSGGVSNSRPWSQLLSNMLQTPVSTMSGSEQGARGAAIYAGVAVGAFADLHQAAAAIVHPNIIFEPQMQYAELYQYKAQRYERALYALEQFHQSP